MNPRCPAWSLEEPRDPAAIDALAKAFRESNYEIRPVLRLLFNSDFFKNARYKHLKSPAEVVVGTLRLVGGHDLPKPGYGEISMQPSYMGQDLLNPPSVEGWHTGSEWINSGSLMARINFVADQLGNQSLPGVRAIIDRLKAKGTLVPEQTCQRMPGPVGADRGAPRHAKGVDRSGQTVGSVELGQRTERSNGCAACHPDDATDRCYKRVSICVTFNRDRGGTFNGVSPKGPRTCGGPAHRR